MNEGLIRYNAQRCEAAQSSKCRCACGGTLHGQAHSEAWIAACVEAYRRAAIPESQIDLLDSDSEGAKRRAAEGRVSSEAATAVKKRA